VFLRDACKVSIAANQVETQVTVTGGRADLVVSGPNLHLIFEAKVASSLHGSQMLSYLNALRESDLGSNGLRGLFIIAPAASVAQLCKEASAQLAVNLARANTANDTVKAYDVAYQKASGESDTETKFGLSGGLELNLLNGFGIQAAYDRGVLKVTLPKRAEAKPRKIDVKVK